MENKFLDNKSIWNENAEFWDNAMGDNSNEFHRNTVRPKVTELLFPNKEDYILDIACGNGNYSAYLASQGIFLVAFDFSEKLISLAKQRQKQYLDKIEFQVVDATKKEELLKLKKDKLYTKAVSNMAIMDISDIEPLFESLTHLLEENGIFVFATQHPCFVTLTEQYITPHNYYGNAIEGQPKEHVYYHRSLQDIFNICFKYGFVVDGFYESSYGKNREIPMVIIVRVRKLPKNN